MAVVHLVQEMVELLDLSRLESLQGQIRQGPALLGKLFVCEISHRYLL